MNEIRVERTIRLFSPAKLNLGLEVVGRRSDGYHEIVTIFQAVSLFDVIDLVPADRFSFHGDQRIEHMRDLALRAIRLFEERVDAILIADVHIQKSIPLAGGLGGGSSDAGTLLAALGTLGGIELGTVERVAAELGSDVPFFVRGGTALATSTGTDLMSLPPPVRGWFVVVTPDVEIPNKTARLYGSLQPVDFSDGSSTRAVARDIERGDQLDPCTMRNAFSRALYEIPEVDRARKSTLDRGAPFVLPCGAGPSVFTTLDRWEDARDLAASLRDAGFRAIACTNVMPNINSGRLR